MSFIKDTRWADTRNSPAVQIAAATFGILALELALIRWTSSQIRIFAYFNNLVLIGAFLGMGLGVALGRRYGGLVHATLPALLLVSVPLAFSEHLHLVRMPFPDTAIALWGAEILTEGSSSGIFYLAFFLVLFLLIVCVFLFAGAAVGHLFPKRPPLKSYSADLLGSLAGILAFSIATFFNASPPVWLAIGCMPFLWLTRTKLSALALAVILLLGWYSIRGAVYSPYNRIDIRQGPFGKELNVNRDFHQYMFDVSDETLVALEAAGTDEEVVDVYHTIREIYDMPFVINDTRDAALVVGAGTGNDVQAALRSGYRRIHSVDIDGEIIRLGKRLHPKRPYDDPRVVPVVNDARAFFEQYRGAPFDIVCYGFLDSHAMFSSMSSLRLDNYVYTEEGIRAAWGHVSDDGHMSIAFSVYAGEWIGERLYWTIERATGIRPVVINHQLHNGVTYLVAADLGNLRLGAFSKYPMIQLPAQGAIKTTTDDWPFLYLRPGAFPLGYVTVLAFVLIVAVISILAAFGRGVISSGFDPILFFMGAAFLLLETRGVTSLSLLFGSTWMVNSAVFAGVLIMAFLANAAVQRFSLKKPAWWFGLLLLSGIAVWAFKPAMLSAYPLMLRGVIGGLVHAVPIGFAGILVSIFLARSRDPAASLGSNLLGAVLGGCLEYSSMYIGLRSLVVIAVLFYLAAFCFFFKMSRAYK